MNAEKVDNAIDAISDWIVKELDKGCDEQGSVARMANALASLVEARAKHY